MTTLLTENLIAGDVIEVRTINDVMTVLVLLATDDFVILDPCDETTPLCGAARGTCRVPQI